MAENEIIEEACEVVSGGVKLPGAVGLPERIHGWVVFAHGAGSGHASPRNRFVASMLNNAGFATLLFDMLTAAEDAPELETRFNIGLLTTRLSGAIDWLQAQPFARGAPLGLFGASTGAAAALRVAAEREVRCVVSRGGRPDLAGREALWRVKCPTLLIVGAQDDLVLALNQRALVELHGQKKLVTVPLAGHLFEEPGTLDIAAQHALHWFEAYLPTRPAAGPA